MKLKLSLFKLATIGNNFVGAILGFLGVLGLINVLTGSNLGLSPRGSRGQAIGVTSGEEVFLIILIAAFFGGYYFALEKVNDNKRLNALMYYAISNAFLKFYLITLILVGSILYATEIAYDFGELLLYTVIASFIFVFHTIVYSTAFFTSIAESLVYSGNSTNNSLQEKLSKLESLKNDGTISESEYNEKRKATIDNYEP